MAIITVSNLSKAYRIGKKAERADSFVGMLQDSVMAPFRNWRKMKDVGAGQGESEDELHWALRDVSFEVQQGDVLGVIGRNGAGKSTLLKILSRITEPTSGQVKIRGRVASLLEVGTGFHPELSGRENVYLNGTILGMHKHEIDRKFDEIVEFSGVEKFLDTPVKRYSSGMKVRLAFSVAAHLDPEILIVDEVLAVGDAEFQKKCMGRMNEVAVGRGKTVIFVSHSMMAVQSLCKKSILMRNGQLVAYDDTKHILPLYTSLPGQCRSNSWVREEQSAGEKQLLIRKICLDIQGRQPNLTLMVTCVLESLQSHANAFIAIDIHNSLGDWLMQAIPKVDLFIESKASNQTIKMEIDLPPLIPGTYPVSIWVGTSFSQTLDWIQEEVEFLVNESPTIGRTFPHSKDRGFCVPTSRIISDSMLR